LYVLKSGARILKKPEYKRTKSMIIIAKIKTEKVFLLFIIFMMIIAKNVLKS
jgi:hypothetical protein